MRFRTPLSVAAAVAAMSLIAAGSAFGQGQKQTQKPLRAAASISLAADSFEVDHPLFNIGQSTISVTCYLDGGATPTSKLLVTAGRTGAIIPSSPEPVLVGPGETTEIGWVNGPDPGAIVGGTVTLALFDGSGVSASGTAAYIIDGTTNRCIATVQVAG